MSDLLLRPHARSSACPGPVVVVVMDGVGVGRRDEGDAVWLARTPVLDRLAAGPTTTLRAHGKAVGMPSDGDMGNSEVGHNALGAGRVFEQGALLVDRALRNGSVFEGDTWRWLVGPCVAEGKALHLIGLLSDGNVHSHQDHLHLMLRAAADAGCARVYVHTLLDGRDVPETSAQEYLGRLETELAALNAGSPGRDFAIASGGGRMVTTMDRYEADWSVVERGWQAHVLGRVDDPARRFPSAGAALDGLRAADPGVIDQFLPSFVIEREGAPVAPIVDGDAVVFFNFRGDRALEISRAFVEDDVAFTAFDRVRRPAVRFAGMMQYDGDLLLPPRFLVTPPDIDRTMGAYLAQSGVSQLACAETQKFGHVTYFWNGNRGQRFADNEEWLEIPSDVVPFEQRPWMKAAEVTDAVVAALLRPQPPRFVRLNYANGDMVGHTGDLRSTILAVEVVDLVLGRLLKAVERVGGVALVTADHGNADQMFQVSKKSGGYTDAAMTSHTLNPVPLHLFDPRGGLKLVGSPTAGLVNVAATSLELLGFAAPDDYEPSLLAKS